MDDLPPLKERLQGLVSYLPIFEDPGFTFGTWEGGQKDASGAIQMPYFVRETQQTHSLEPRIRSAG